jgi:hypothetical protein
MITIVRVISDNFISKENKIHYIDVVSLSCTSLSEISARREQNKAEVAERAWQRHAANYVVFLLFFLISVVVMVIIYGGIQQDGLVLTIHKRTIDTSTW